MIIVNHSNKLNALANAIKAIDVNRVKPILKESPDLVNMRLNTPHYDDGETVLCFAISTPRKGESYTENMVVTKDQAVLIEAILDDGANINERRGTNSGMAPLGTAAWLGKSGFVELLLKRGADPNYEPEPGDTALGVAADHSHTSQ